MSTRPNLPVRDTLKVLYSWQAPERVWQARGRGWYLGYALVFLIVIAVAVRLEYYILVVGVIALMALWYIQASIPPWIVKHQITSRGIYAFETLTKWEEIKCFWLAKKQDFILLHIDFPLEKRKPRLTLVLDTENYQQIFEICIERLDYGDPSQVEYTYISRFLYGKYIPISSLLEDLDSPANLV